MVFHRNKTTLFTAISLALLITGCSSDDNDDALDTSFTKPAIFTGFPVTLKDAPGNNTTSVKYTGQMVRQVYRETVKAVVKAPGTTDETASAELVNRYLKNENGIANDDNIIAPADKTGFDIKEVMYSEVGSGNLYGKTFDTSSGQADAIPGIALVDANITLGVPGNKSARETLDLWVANFAKTNAANGGTDGYVDFTNGYDYNQLFPKFLMGAVFYNQSMDKYLDEFMAEAGTQDNDKPYNGDADNHYTGKEHSWDEGFGYWGAAANYGLLTAEENVAVNKRSGATAAANADWDEDGMVSLYTEYTSGPAYYAATFDQDTDPATPSTYGADMMDAWLTGRTLITNAVDANGDARLLTDDERASLVTLAATIQENWEMVLAEAVHKYAGNSHNTLADLQLNPTDIAAQKAYYKQWGELKGFMLALQFGGIHSKIDKTKFEEIDNLIGFGPVLANGQQVTGVAGDTFNLSADLGTDTVASNVAIDAYQVNLKTVQTTLDAFYTLKVKQSLIP